MPEFAISLSNAGIHRSGSKKANRFIPGFILLMGWTSALAQTGEPPVYEIGAIPDQRVWYNAESDGLTFDVIAPSLGENPTISASWDENRQPDGLLEFDTELNRLRFVPAASDSEAFDITFLAVGSGAPIFKTVAIEPLQPLPPEAAAFGVDPLPSSLPDMEGRDYIDVEDDFNGDSVYFNEVDGVETKTVRITGKRIVWEPGHQNTLYENYHDKTNIRDLTIEAQTLVIRAPLHFPQTNLTIRAAELIFENPDEGDVASISTEPLRPAGGVAPSFGETSENGHKGGNMQIQVHDIQQPDGTAIRFIARGGRGRDASPGKKGVDRAKRTALSRNPGSGISLGNDYVLFVWVVRPGILADIYKPDKANYDGSVSWGTSLLAPDGTSTGGNGIAGQKPGDGGDGGDVSSNLDITAILNQQGGGMGTPAATVSGGRGATVEPSGGGALRQTAYRVKIETDTFGNVTGQSTATFTSQNGAAAPGPVADKPVGANGVFDGPDSDSVSWLSPSAFRMALAYLNDTYLEGHISVVSEELEVLLGIIEVAEASPEWAALSEDEAADLMQIKDELFTLRHRIGSNLDFFGNPAGWVPMLSFEVNKLAFDDEIDRAIRVMYLNYWLGSIATTVQQNKEAMEAMRTQLLAQVETDRDSFEAAVQEIPVVQNDAENLQVDIDQVIREIQAIEDALLPKAKSIVVLKKTARTLGKIAQTIPVYQPALGIAGGAVAASADIDPNKSWQENSILVGQGAAAGFASGAALTKAQAAQSATSQINTNDPANNEAARQALTDAREPLLQLLQDSYNTMSASKGSDPEVTAELERLLAEVPEFNALKKEMEELNIQKRDFIYRLSELIQQITVLPIAISRNLRTINLLNEEINAANDRLDPATLSYLDDMNRRARARLLKYHYYMAKAFSYRRLEAYPGKLDLGAIQTKFEELATDPDDPSGATLTADQFNSFKAVYEEQVSTVASSILNDANQNPPEQSIAVEFNLPADIIAAINAGENPRINLKDFNLFPKSEENLRITDLTVKSMQASYDSGAPIPNTVDLVIQHSGISILQKDGQSYQFRHNNERTRSLIQWKSRYQFSNQALTPSRPSAAASSLIAALVPEAQNLLVYSRPAVIADLILSLDSSATAGSKVQLEQATLEVKYDYTQKSQSFRTLEILAGGTGFEAQIELDTVDRNDRSVGRGEFERTYNVGETVTVTAPAVVGDMRFVRWTGIPVADPTAAIQQITLSDNITLRAVYEPATRYVLTVIGGIGDGNYFPGEIVTISADDPQEGKRFLEWLGGLPDDPTSAVTTIPVLGSDTIIAQFANVSAGGGVVLSILPAGEGDLRLLLEAESDGDWILEHSSDGNIWSILTTISVEGGVGSIFLEADQFTRFYRALAPPI
jgi:hypothetical protein